jgi:hypothetical protein
MDPRAQVALCSDALARASRSSADADVASVAGRLAALLENARGEELALDWLDLEALSTPAASLRAAVLAARAAGADGAVIDRRLVCAGLDLADEAARADSVFSKKEWNDADWRVAGARIARTGGRLDSWPREETAPDLAYASFLARLEAEREKIPAAKSSAKPPTESEVHAALRDGWVQGCERAYRRLRARQSVLGANELVRYLRVLFQRSQHPLRRELSARRFPPISPVLLIDVDSREPWIGF